MVSVKSLEGVLGQHLCDLEVNQPLPGTVWGTETPTAISETLTHPGDRGVCIRLICIRSSHTASGSWLPHYLARHETAEENVKAEKRRESLKEMGSCQWLQWHERLKLAAAGCGRRVEGSDVIC